MKTTIRVICFTLLLSAFPFRAAAEDFTNAIHAYLQQRVEAEKRDASIVVGLVDEHGSRIVSCEKMDIHHAAGVPDSVGKKLKNE